MKTRLLAGVVAAGVLGLLAWVGTAIGAPPAPLTGAIFTTNSACTQVNGNIYAAKTDVYLDGGPARPGAAGLPDGQYYYQITDPSGATLLAGPFAPAGIPDTSGKVITVVGGEFTTCLQLAPFNTTPNPGGEYKAWVTRVGDFSPGGENFGFINSLSKTDNFKVRESIQPPPDCPPASICGRIFVDDACTRNCVLDGHDFIAAGFFVTVDLDTPSGSTLRVITDTGAFCFNDLLPGTYTLYLDPAQFEGQPATPCPPQEITVDCGDQVIANVGAQRD